MLILRKRGCDNMINPHSQVMPLTLYQTTREAPNSRKLTANNRPNQGTFFSRPRASLMDKEGGKNVSR